MHNSRQRHKKAASLGVDDIPSGAKRSLTIIARRRNGKAVKRKFRQMGSHLTVIEPILEKVELGVVKYPVGK